MPCPARPWADTPCGLAGPIVQHVQYQLLFERHAGSQKTRGREILLPCWFYFDSRELLPRGVTGGGGVIAIRRGRERRLATQPGPAMSNRVQDERLSWVADEAERPVTMAREFE